MTSFFFHPDYTVGIGIAPIQRRFRSRTVTAGGEFRPALKICYLLSYKITDQTPVVKWKILWYHHVELCVFGILNP